MGTSSPAQRSTTMSMPSPFTLTMVGATITNLIIGEYAIMVQTVILGVLSGWVAWVRFRQYEGARYHVGSPATG